MANETKAGEPKVDVKSDVKPVVQDKPRDRKNDVERLAATIFSQRAFALSGQYEKQHIVNESLDMAKLFYKTCDAPEVKPESEESM